MSKFYLTTAIAYTSKKPHIGNTYDVVLADMIARYKRMMGFDVYFQTGSDEHGQKIEELANAKGITPKEYVDQVVEEIKASWDCLDVTYDRFIRTTDHDHEEAVKKIFKKLYDQGDIYKGEYEGKYCVPCESFFTESQLVDGKCPDCGREVKDAKEEAYFLRLSKYQDRLIEYYENNPDFIKPDSRKNEMINNFLKPGLEDLCVSRSSFKWGIPVEFDDKHVIYVWIDALSNYITGLGYSPDGSGELYKKYWPADLHVIGKDIVRFHTIYWPIMLMALGEPLPKQILGHPWLLFANDKMSKSKGNVIYADDLVSRFGADAVRYYMLSEMPYAQDGNITYESFINKYNSDLANNLGNLVNRTVTMTNKYFGGSVTRPESYEDIDIELKNLAESTKNVYFELMDDYHNADTAGKIITLCKRLNKYIDETTPWLLAKDESKKSRLNDVMYNLLEGIRFVSVMLKPFMPSTSAEILRQLGRKDESFEDIKSFAEPEKFSVAEASVLFARIDLEKTLNELNKAIPNETAENQDADNSKAGSAANKSKPIENTLKINEITIDDFMKTELIAAKIIKAEKVEKSKKLLKLTLFDGSGERTVASGISEFYKPEELCGKTVILVSNLKPAKLCGVESCGMILAADTEGGVKVLFLDDVPAGSRIR